MFNGMNPELGQRQLEITGLFSNILGRIILPKLAQRFLNQNKTQQYN
jgi:hypothetical protein